jgi:hypothetical protein
VQKWNRGDRSEFTRELRHRQSIFQPADALYPIAIFSTQGIPDPAFSVKTQEKCGFILTREKYFCIDHLINARQWMCPPLSPPGAGHGGIAFRRILLDGRRKPQEPV